MLFCSLRATTRQPLFPAGSAADGPPQPAAGDMRAPPTFLLAQWEASFTGYHQLDAAARIQQAGAGATAAAMRASSVALVTQQLQELLLGIDADARSCTLGGDRALAQLRIQMQASRGSAEYFADDIVMTIPGVGQYHGVAAVEEYIGILTDPSFNDNNHVQLQSFQTVSLDPANADVLRADEEAVSAWQNFSRVSAPVFNHTFEFRACSARLKVGNDQFRAPPPSNKKRPRFEA